MLLLILPVIVDTSAVIAFVYAPPRLTESYQFGWSFVVAVLTAIYTVIPSVVFLTRSRPLYIYCTYL